MPAITHAPHLLCWGPGSSHVKRQCPASPAHALSCLQAVLPRSVGRVVAYLATVIVQWLTDPFQVEARCGQNEVEVFQPSILPSETLWTGVVSQGMRSGLGLPLVTLWGWTGTLIICCRGLLVTCWQERSPCCLPLPEFLRAKGAPGGQPLAPPAVARARWPANEM